MLTPDTNTRGKRWSRTTRITSPCLPLSLPAMTWVGIHVCIHSPKLCTYVMHTCSDAQRDCGVIDCKQSVKPTTACMPLHVHQSVLIITCTMSPRTILQLLGLGNMALMAFKGLLGTAAASNRAHT